MKMHSYSFQEELERFKTDINLTEFAASFGYSLDRKESSRNTAVMRDAQGDKICISKSSRDNHWVYWSARDNQDSGSIIDFIQKREGGSIGDVRRTLRRWSGGVEPEYYISDLKPSSPDIQKVLVDYSKTQPAPEHPYLVNVREIPITTLEDPKFEGRVRIDEHRNAIFPHFDEEGIVGFEKKNQNFAGFSPHGRRGLWTSVPQKTDTQLVITESAIDALSFHALYADEQNRYLSIGGQLGKKQTELIKRAANKLPEGSTIVIAVDSDQQGEKYAQEIRNALRGSGGRKQGITRMVPTAKDWNDDLKASHRQRTNETAVELEEWEREIGDY